MTLRQKSMENLKQEELNIVLKWFSQKTCRWYNNDWTNVYQKRLSLFMIKQFLCVFLIKLLTIELLVVCTQIYAGLFLHEIIFLKSFKMFILLLYEYVKYCKPHRSGFSCGGQIKICLC